MLNFMGTGDSDPRLLLLQVGSQVAGLTGELAKGHDFYCKNKALFSRRALCIGCLEMA